MFGESGATGGGCLYCAMAMILSQLSVRARDMIDRQRWEEVILLLQGPVRQNRGWDEGLFLLAQAKYQLGRLAEAFPCIREAIGVRADKVDYYLLLGHIFRKAGHPDDAANAYHACRELQPDFVPAWIALGGLAREQRKARDARVFFESALKLRPHDPNIQTNLATVLADAGWVRESIELLEAALRTNPAAHLAHSNLLLTLHYDSGTTPERLAAEHRLWAQRHVVARPRAPRPSDLAPERRLRLGFLSADFKNHPVGRFMEVLWRHLSRDAFEVIAYDAGTATDNLTASLRLQARSWYSLAGLSDREAAARIRKDGVDVLCDLSGHSAGNRLLVFSEKPAPIQATWFAYPNTTGLTAMDYRLTDELADPVGSSESFYVEKLLRFKQIAWLYRPPDVAYGIRPLPHSRGQPFTFGCLNKPAKASAASLAAWAEILRRCPKARLRLQTQDDADRLEDLSRELIRAGARADQLQFVHPGPPEQYYESHYDVDLMLDPFPYNGAVTTADALWMGVPALSLAGHTYVSRQGVCLLRNLGLEDWLCGSPEEYVQKGVHAAEQPQSLAALNTELRDRLTHSPMMNYAGFAAEFESLLRDAWRKLCAAG